MVADHLDRGALCLPRQLDAAIALVAHEPSAASFLSIVVAAGADTPRRSATAEVDTRVRSLLLEHVDRLQVVLARLASVFHRLR